VENKFNFWSKITEGEKVNISNNNSSNITLVLLQNNICFMSFRKIAKETNRFVMPVSPSVHMEQIGSHWTNFHAF